MIRSDFRRLRLAGLLLLVSTTLAAQDIPRPTELGGKPFFLKSTWHIGGEGNWDYLTLDPDALQLFVAHGQKVQVIDLSAGTLVGEIPGLRDAHGIALDDHGAFGFISDGPANMVRIFDRSSFAIVASVPTGPNPRAIVYEPLTKLIFAICTQPVGDTLIPEANPPAPGGNANSQTAANRTGNVASPPEARSIITVIDAETRMPLANLLLRGKLGSAQADSRGQVYVSLVDRNRIAYFDAQALATQLHQPPAKPSLQPSSVRTGQPAPAAAIPTIDWSAPPSPTVPSVPTEDRLHTFRLGPACAEPTALAVDGNHMRLFSACNNQKLEILNTGSGQVVATLPIGPGTEAIGYDSTHGLIFTANGGGLGSVTVIRQDVNDTYAVIQELPTAQRARTLAVNPTSGEVYLVTNLMGIDVKQQGISGGKINPPIIQPQPVQGSFQVLVLGN